MDVHVTYDGEEDTAWIQLVPVRAGDAARAVPGADDAKDVRLVFNHDSRLIGIEVVSASGVLPPDFIAQADELID